MPIIVTVFSTRPADVQRIAQKQDSSRALVFVFVVGAALVSLLGVIILLKNTPGLSKRAAHLHIFLEFPSESQPDYLNFAYFSFMIGMTFQVSDVSIKSRGISG